MTALRGFALPAVLLLVTLAAMLSADALLAATQAAAYSSRMAARLRVFEAAEGGLARATAALRRSPAPSPVASHDRSDGTRAFVETKLDRVDTVPAGYSAGRIQVQQWRIRSEGRGPDAGRVAVAAGLARHVALP